MLQSPVRTSHDLVCVTLARVSAVADSLVVAVVAVAVVAAAVAEAALSRRHLRRPCLRSQKAKGPADAVHWQQTCQ